MFINFAGIGNSFMYVPISVSILQYFDDKKSLANGIAMSGSGMYNKNVKKCNYVFVILMLRREKVISRF